MLEKRTRDKTNIIENKKIKIGITFLNHHKTMKCRSNASKSHQVLYSETRKFFHFFIPTSPNGKKKKMVSFIIISNQVA